MIRKDENSVSWKAGALAVAVHVALLAALLISFNWKAAHTVLNVTEVDLWDKLPAQSVPKVEPKPEPKLEPIVKEEPKPEPKPDVKVEEKQKLEEQQAEIALEKKRQELAEKERQMAEKERLLEEKRKKDEEKKKLLAAMREDTLQEKPKKNDNALKKLQQDALSEEKGDSDKKASAASASEIGAYIEKIRAKIRGNVNNAACGNGSPEVRFSIDLLPSGELSGNPRITKSSEITACDDAVERAIIGSQPFSLPQDVVLKAKFRNLNLKVRPNDN